MDYLAFSFQGIRYQAMGACVSGVVVTKEPQCCSAIFLPVFFLTEYVVYKKDSLHRLSPEILGGA